MTSAALDVAHAPARRMEIAGMSAIELGAPGDPLEVVFVHANGFHAALYVSMLAPLAAGRRVLAVDLRGHGRTDLPADPDALTNWRPFAEDLARALDALEAEGAPPVVLAGHSMGAGTSLLATALRPERVRALGFVEPVLGPPLFHAMMKLRPFNMLFRRTFPLAKAAARRRERFDDHEAAYQAYHGRGAFRSWPDETLRAYVEEGFGEDGDGVRLRCAPAWEAACFSAQGNPLWPALAKARVPIVIRAGEAHSTVRPLVERLLEKARPDVDFARVPGTTHFLPQERPDVARETIELALERSSPRSA